jgi:hypothetical protein
MSSNAATVAIRAMGRAELPVRIEKYDWHVYIENTDASGLGLHNLSTSFVMPALGDCQHCVESKSARQLQPPHPLQPLQPLQPLPTPCGTWVNCGLTAG